MQLPHTVLEQIHTTDPSSEIMRAHGVRAEPDQEQLVRSVWDYAEGVARVAMRAGGRRRQLIAAAGGAAFGLLTGTLLGAALGLQLGARAGVERGIETAVRCPALLERVDPTTPGAVARLHAEELCP